jgi:hypothetical protein
MARRAVRDMSIEEFDHWCAATRNSEESLQSTPGKKPRRTVNLVNFPSGKVLHCHLCGAAFASASSCAA